MSDLTSIKGFTRPRLPRLGKIHLGVKVKGAKAEYPKETDYFVVPEEVAKVYGTTPKVLEVVFPVGDPAIVAPYAFKKYAAAGLSCKGDGEEYIRWTEQGIENGECPGPEDCPFAKDGKGRTVCKAVMNLFVMLPRVSLGGVYQIDTSSWHSITNILSQIAWAQGAYGRAEMIPFFLKRVPKETQYEVGKKQTHYVMELHLPDNATLKTLAVKANEVRVFLRGVDDRLALPAPKRTEIEADQYPADIVDAVKANGGEAEQVPEVNPTPEKGKPSSQRLPRKEPKTAPTHEAPPAVADLPPEDDRPPMPHEEPPDDLDLGGVV